MPPRINMPPGTLDKKNKRAFGRLVVYAKKIAILLLMALISSIKCTFSKYLKSLVWNKVNAPWKNAWKLINMPARLFHTIE